MCHRSNESWPVWVDEWRVEEEDDSLGVGAAAARRRLQGKQTTTTNRQSKERVRFIGKGELDKLRSHAAMEERISNLEECGDLLLADDAARRFWAELLQSTAARGEESLAQLLTGMKALVVLQGFAGSGEPCSMNVFALLATVAACLDPGFSANALLEETKRALKSGSVPVFDVSGLERVLAVPGFRDNALMRLRKNFGPWLHRHHLSDDALHDAIATMLRRLSLPQNKRRLVRNIRVTVNLEAKSAAIKIYNKVKRFPYTNIGGFP